MAGTCLNQWKGHFFENQENLTRAGYSIKLKNNSVRCDDGIVLMWNKTSSASYRVFKDKKISEIYFKATSYPQNKRG